MNAQCVQTALQACMGTAGDIPLWIAVGCPSLEVSLCLHCPHPVSSYRMWDCLLPSVIGFIACCVVSKASLAVLAGEQVTLVC